ncbi:MAG: flavodoxin [Syntrophomonas sp.]
MATAIVIYGSSTGNTEKLAQVLAEELQQNFSVILKDVVDADPKDMADKDLIVLGASTWNDGELQEDFLDFYDEMDSVDLKGKKAAIFGTGDSSWDEFCKAVDILEEKVKGMHADLIAPGFKWDGELSEQAAADIREWGKKLH